MVLDIDGRTRLPEPIRWLARLQAAWEDQRGDAGLPIADELFLADLAELVPSLVLAHRDDETGGFRVDFAGTAARGLLALEAVGETPEHGPAEHPLAWLGAGFLAARRPAAPGPRWLHSGDLVGLFLPYAGFDGRVILILAGIARCPGSIGAVGSAGRVVRLARHGGRA